MSINIRKIGALITLTVILIGSLNGLDTFTSRIIISGLWYTIAMASIAIISVAIAYKVWPSSPFSVATVMLIVLISREHEIIDLALFMSWYADVSVWEALLEAADTSNWYRILLPLVVGVSASFALKHLTKNSRGTSAPLRPLN